MSTVALPPPSLKGNRTASHMSQEVAEAVLNAALAAHRAGTLLELLHRRSRTARRIAKRWLIPVIGSAGDLLRPDPLCEAVALLLGWLITQLRPDQRPHLEEGIDSQAWLERTSWRPMLALACHYGFLGVPDFPWRYRRRTDESAADNLCGLWSVGPSTFYRYLEKGKRLLLGVLLESTAFTAERKQSLRQFVGQHVYIRHALACDGMRAEWHRRQISTALRASDTPSALWHALKARDAAVAIDLLRRYRNELANDPETDFLVAQCEAAALDERLSFDFQLAVAGLWRERNADEREQEAYARALKIAAACKDKLMLGAVYGALGKFHEPRDTDRAFTCFEDSAEYLRQASAELGEAVPAVVLEEYVAALLKLAWHYLSRNDPRSRAILERAELVRGSQVLPEEVAGTLQQYWGEYYRRAGDLHRALEHKLKALNIFERLNDQPQILSTYNNLVLIYTELKAFDKAVEYGGQVVLFARKASVDPYVYASVLLNLGAALFWQGRYDEAIDRYSEGLRRSLEAKLPVLANRARYNLAEALYKRFQISGNPDDERRGDEYAAEVLRAAPQERDSVLQEATRQLKSEVLGSHEGFVLTRLVPEETAVHLEEMIEVQRQRALLAVPGPPEAQVQARLAIARAYLKIVLKERDLALELVDRHGLRDRFSSQFEELRVEPSPEEGIARALAVRWKQVVGSLLSDERRSILLSRLLNGEVISKSTYAELCSVGLATASKHLSMLAERGLLVQTGKGPMTRYHLQP